MSNDAKRKFPRREFNKPVAYLSQGLSEVATGIEIGEGGISFATDLVLSLDRQVIVNFFVPNGDFFSLKTEIKNQVKSTDGKIVYGLSFNEVSLGLKRQIRAYVARMSVTEQK